MLLAVELSFDWVSHFLFEDPSWAIVALAVVLVVVRLIGRRTGNKKLLLASWLPLVLMLALWASSSLVTTHREQLVQTMQDMLLSVEDGDMPTFRAIVAEDADIYFPPGDNPPRFSRQQVEDRLSPIKVSDILLLGVQSAMVGDNDAATVIRIRIDAELGGMAGIQIHTWEITWAYRDGRWQATRMQCTEAGFNPLGGGE